ncbi:type VI secretion system tip protein VgrG [Chitinibacter fontanus]|uniref:Type VI secretion system tip protein VgrG n=1 Tax=Chitinibacter fontanus TaxID=1737446 RepID=A0A7D5ZJH5_9NEIS|nr:type VI secretion system Vgr family protein [Chitinibacter fontanus]QLI83308.1 type VI secretion system tip protein VgrG [Chitinibacter fontanus]
MNLSDLLSSFAAAFNQDQRLITLQLGDGSAWGEQLLPQSVTGREGVNQPYRYSLECLSPDGAIELKSLLGLPVVIGVTDSEGGVVERCGVVSQAQLLGSDGGFAKYGLQVEPPFALLRHRRTSRVFQDISVPDIIKQVIGEHQAANSVFAAVQTLDFKLSGTHPQRSYCLQYRESDYDFLVRLMHEEGLAWRFEHQPADSPQVQLVVFDDAFALPEASDSLVRFHRADATEESDALLEWTSQRQVGSNNVALTTFDYKASNTSHSGDESAVDQGDGGQQLQASFEDYDPQSLYYASDAEQLSHYAQLRQQAHDSQKKSFSGSGTLRSLQAGQWFRLEDHPAHEWDSAEQREFAITELTFTAHNNLPHDLTQQLRQIAPSLLASNTATNSTTDTPAPYRVEFKSQRRGQPITPEFNLNGTGSEQLAKPKSRGVQTATVVGPAGEEIHTDEMGRIKVQFHWQRPNEHADFGANLDDKSSCWIRVAYPSAGASWGHQFIPRIGQEVLVDFIEGDIDRPIVTGVVYNGSHPTPTFSGAGALPANKTLSGIKSKEYKGGQYGELLFDDSTGQVRTKLSSEHAKTQLNLGYLIHPRSNGKGEARGEGFELRTDAHGAIRAGHGLLLTTEAKGGAAGKQLDRNPATSQLESALELAKSLGEVATKQLADTIETGESDQTIKPDNSNGEKHKTGHLHHHVHAAKSWEAGSNTDADGKSKSEDQAGQQPLLMIHGQDGLALTTPNSLTQTAGSNIDQVAQRDSNQTTGRRWIHNVGQHISLFVAGVKDSIALKLIAAKGKVQLQAQSGDIEIVGDKDLKVTACKETITVVAKDEILVTAGGGYIRLKGGDIEIHCPGTVSVKGANHKVSGPDQMTAQHPAFPNSMPKQRLTLNLQQAPNAQGFGWAGMPYRLFADGAQIKEGVLDESGHLPIEHEIVTQHYKLELANGVNYQIPVPTEYRNSEQGVLANQGFQKHASATDSEVRSLNAHSDLRKIYQDLLDGKLGSGDAT